MKNYTLAFCTIVLGFLHLVKGKSKVISNDGKAFLDYSVRWSWDTNDITRWNVKLEDLG